MHCTWAWEEATLFWLPSTFLLSSSEGCPQSSKSVSLGSWLISQKLPSELVMLFARILSPSLKQQLSPTQLQTEKPSWEPRATGVQRVGKQHKNSSSGSTSTVCPTSISSVQKEQQTLSIKQRKLPEWKSPTDLIWRQPTIDKGPVHKAARFVSSTAPLPGAAWTTRQCVLLAWRCYQGLAATSQLSLYRARSFWALYCLSARFC